MSTYTTSLPVEYGGHEGYLKLKHEEEMVVWLWAFPRLLPWPRPIAWISSPVTGKNPWPGDLWGVDSGGELLVIECKNQPRSDPFSDFVEFYSPGHPELKAQNLRKRWEKKYDAELSYTSSLTERPVGKTPGLLPRSSKRKAICRWDKLGEMAGKEIRTNKYAKTVKMYLRIREEKQNPTPHYLGLLAVSDRFNPALSDNGNMAMKTLRDKVGSDRVGLYLGSARVIENNQVRLSIKMKNSVPK